jgi:hypothetical protein
MLVADISLLITVCDDVHLLLNSPAPVDPVANHVLVPAISERGRSVVCPNCNAQVSRTFPGNLSVIRFSFPRHFFVRYQCSGSFSDLDPNSAPTFQMVLDPKYT